MSSVPVLFDQDPIAAGECVPGVDGVPDSAFGHLMGGTWIDSVTTVVAGLGRRWPLVGLGVALLALGAFMVVWWRRRRWRRHAADAVWLEITPPVTATPAATVALWRLLATLLPAPRRWTTRPARLVWEVAADPDGMRCGLWIPPGVNPSAVIRVLHRGWPGARAEQATPPTFDSRHRVIAAALASTRPEWLPLVDDDSPRSRRGDAATPEEDRMRAVYDGLAAAGRTGGGLLQVHIGRAPARRLRPLRRATVRPDRAWRPRGPARLASLAADAVRAVLNAVLEAVTPGPSHRHTTRQTTLDPYTADLARQARAKYSAGPHLLVAVHAAATGPTRAAAKAAAADISAGYGLLSGRFARRRLRHGATTVRSRWVPAGRMVVASVAEAAALASLPAEPPAYGMPAAASRRRAASRDIFRTETHPPTARPAPMAPVSRRTP